MMSLKLSRKWDIALMKNKIYLQKHLLFTIIIILAFLVLNSFLHIIEYNTYQKNYNYKISGIINEVRKQYPEVTDDEIMKIIDNYDKENSFLSKYGIDLEKDAIILGNNTSHIYFMIINCILLLLLVLILIFVFFKYNNQKDKEIRNITKYIEEINHKNYSLKLDDLSEDELSILKNEIYKTTIMLKESADNALRDKQSLKKSLEDISHQIKTPLTSITIILDNLIDNPQMEEEQRKKFLHELKRETLNINFLVQALLKLSKFDVNTISFHNKKILVQNLINRVCQNVSSICDLRNIIINVDHQKDIYLNVDDNWQVEALTNILKNAIDYSKDGSEVKVSYEENSVYVKITITNSGMIDENDLKHLFERFYQGKNAKKESVGIGLALAKAIIEKNNGSISAISKNAKTSFIIKYFRI